MSEQDLQQTLIASKQILGEAAPRLILEKPQVATRGITHGLTGQYTFLSPTELIAYATTGADYVRDMGPVGTREILLLQRIIDTDWRLSRIPHLAQDLQYTSITNQNKKLTEAFPKFDSQALDPYANGNVYRADADLLNKLARYETTLNRLLHATNKEFDRVQTLRLARKNHVEFNLDECPAFQKYNELIAVATNLVDARKELTKKSKVIYDPPFKPDDSIDSKYLVVRKSLLEILQPLTKNTLETIQTARQWGLLNALERTIPVETMAA